MCGYCPLAPSSSDSAYKQTVFESFVSNKKLKKKARTRAAGVVGENGFFAISIYHNGLHVTVALAKYCIDMLLLCYRRGIGNHKKGFFFFKAKVKS